jgi:hypothetical protein
MSTLNVLAIANAPCKKPAGGTDVRNLMKKKEPPSDSLSVAVKPTDKLDQIGNFLPVAHCTGMYTATI